MPDTDVERAKLFVEHYHKLIDITSEHFQRRNRSSVWLTLAVGIASLLTWKPQETTPLFVKALIKDATITDANSLPLQLLQSVFLAVIFYLTVNLFHHEGSLWRHYKYLGVLEQEIRSRLGISNESFVFGLQHCLYPSTKIRVQGTIRWAYAAIVGLLLFWFLFGQLRGDFVKGSRISLIIDSVISLLTVSYFIAYLLAPSLLERSWNKAEPDQASDTRERVSRINWLRLIIGGMICAVILFLTDGFFHERVVGVNWKAVYGNLGIAEPQHGGAGIAYFAVFELGRGFVSMVLYAMMRLHFRPGPKTAAAAGFLAWIAFSVTGPAQFIPLGFFSNTLWIKVAAFQLVTSILAAVAGAFVYKDRNAQPLAQAR